MGFNSTYIQIKPSSGFNVDVKYFNFIIPMKNVSN